MECKQEKNKEYCSCTYQTCSRKGLCCECISYHREHGGAPGCLFPPEAERTYDRSLKKLARCFRA
ncbi:DUF6485 family protein [Pelotomaculum terephthalicicum JT]|uniref:DUF6485 family protein n=1 Tax=Pelotomaculum terephthalicicum TaxID=206393 RepID=UPI001F03E311|nr:DUF6485 family protein [Pelotomaculum terephthalicicum]MCG9969125.1 DUF6485 family protein [Pelotomaculum terephthalicicum JT]